MGFILFSNKEIVRDFLRNDGVHLNEAETEVLRGGFVDHINDFILYNGFRYNMIIYSKENNPLSTPSKLKKDWFTKKIKKVCSNSLSIDELINIRHTYPNNPMIGYLNIISLRNEIISLREIIYKTPLDILGVDETKLDENLPDLQFQLKYDQFPQFLRDRNSKGGGKMVFAKQELLVKRIQSLETTISVTMCIEPTITKKNCCTLFT